MADDDDDLEAEDTPDEEALEEEAPEEEAPEEEEQPRAKVTILTIVLITLNWVAALAFLYLLLMDYKVRQDWSYGVLRNYVGIWGLPLRDEELTPGYHESKPRLRLEPGEIKQVYSSRGGIGATAFAAVDEPMRFQVLPSHMKNEELKRDVFTGVGAEVETLEDEMERVKKEVPAKIREEAEKVAAEKKTDAERRSAAEAVLLPLSWNVYQVEKLKKQIDTTSGEELNALLVDALQRRMYTDFLAPVNLFRPGDREDFRVEKVADRAYKIDDLQKLFELRCDAAISTTYNPETHQGKHWAEAATTKEAQTRDPGERRQKIAFLLLTLDHIRIPLTDRLLETGGLARTQVVVGVYELAIAMQNYAKTLQVLDDRMREAVRGERDGDVVAGKDGPTRTQSFADRYASEVQGLKKMSANVKHEEDRLEDLKAQRDRFKKVHDERAEQLKIATAKLVAARKDTADSIDELRVLQRQLFEAESELANAADRNFRLESQIRAAEGRLKERTQP